MSSNASYAAAVTYRLLEGGLYAAGVSRKSHGRRGKQFRRVLSDFHCVWNFSETLSRLVTCTKYVPCFKWCVGLNPTDGFSRLLI